MDLVEIKTKTEHYFIDASGDKQGEYKSWYSNGKPMVYCHYLNDKLHGGFKSWYVNGIPHIHCHYLNGVLHGEYKSWHNNGQLWEHCNYLNGLKHGEYKDWRQNGNPRAHTVFVNGVDMKLHPANIDHKERFIMTMMHGVWWLPAKEDERGIIK